MAKKQEALQPITPQEVADEMNTVMAYGVDPDSGEVTNPDEQIDLEQDEEALVEDILARAAEDLRMEDEESFTEDAWNWFLDNGINPAGDEDPEAEPEAPAKPANKNKEKTAAAPAKAEKAPAKPASKPAKAADGEEKKGIKKAMVPGGNESKAIELAKSGATLEDFIAEFTAIYEASGNKDKAYAVFRAKIYYGIGYKKARLVPPSAGKAAKPASKEKAAAPAEAAAPAPKGRSRQPEPEPESEPEAPAKPRGRGRR